MQLPPLSALLPGRLPRGLDDLGGWPPWPLGPFVFAAAVAWLVTSRRRSGPAWLRSLLGALAVAGLGVAVAVGLAAEPATHVQQVGPEGIPMYTHTDGDLTWYLDRAEETLPRPWVLWLPSWIWRGLVLAWALWLAGRFMSLRMTIPSSDSRGHFDAGIAYS